MTAISSPENIKALDNSVENYNKSENSDEPSSESGEEPGAKQDESWVPEWLQDCWQKIQTGEEFQQDQDIVGRAFQLAYELHKGQTRASGEPYILHPVQVASLLRDLDGGSAMIAAGFLHDVVEDTSVSLEEIEAKFGSQVRQLVEGVTKLSKLNFDSKAERQAENFRRMFVSMSKDIRVIVVKLADRLHNMRTLEHLPRHKQMLIARETREIFAPLANRLGIGQFKWELEDLAFKYLETEQYREMQALVAETRSSREARINEAADFLRVGIAKIGLSGFEVSGRPKHLYGIYDKMQRQQKPFSEIYDIAAVRVIVNNNDECYRVLAIAHDCFRPVPGRFKDYIALPKPNGYQSLHTAVIDSGGQPLEIQIRTWEMHSVAEFGIAAHWKYKESNSSNLFGDNNSVNDRNSGNNNDKFNWLKQLVEFQKDIKDDQEYIDSLKQDLFDGEIYVFTPKGDVHCLPRGATPVDFAYRIHTEVGNHCAGALVNQRMVSLDRKLQNGDTVMILRQNNAHPSLDWINYAATSTAKNRIRQWYKRSHREQNLLHGRELLEKELGKSGLDSLLKSEQMAKVVERCNYHSNDDLLAALGYGEISVNAVTNKLREPQSNISQSSISQSNISQSNISQSSVSQFLNSQAINKLPAPLSRSPILGIEGMIYHIAGCCNPLPGEPIIGVVTLGSNRSISIHKQDCPNFMNLERDRLIAVSWNKADQCDRPATYPVDIQFETIDRVGVLKDILSRLADHKVNVRDASVKTAPGKTAFITMKIEISDRAQFEKICSQITKMADIISIRRVNQNIA